MVFLLDQREPWASADLSFDTAVPAPDSKRALNQRWINLRIFNQNMLNQRWDRASIQRQFAHTVHRRFNVEWEANDDGVSIPFQPLFNDYGRILVDSTAVCSILFQVDSTLNGRRPTTARRPLFNLYSTSDYGRIVVDVGSSLTDLFKGHHDMTLQLN